MLYIDKGLNDAWVRPEHVRQTAPGRFISFRMRELACCKGMSR